MFVKRLNIFSIVWLVDIWRVDVCQNTEHIVNSLVG